MMMEKNSGLNPRKLSMQMHPLWSSSMRALWKASGGDHKEMSYSVYKDLRLAIDKAFKPESSYEQSLKAVWKEWIGWTKQSVLTSLMEFSLSKDKITFSGFNSRIFTLIDDESCNFVLYLFKLNTVILYVTQEHSNSLKAIDLITSVSSVYYSIIHQKSKNYRNLSYNDWHNQNIVPVYHIKNQVKSMLRKLFPLDRRVIELWDTFKSAKKDILENKLRQSRSLSSIKKKRIKSSYYRSFLSKESARRTPSRLPVFNTKDVGYIDGISLKINPRVNFRIRKRTKDVCTAMNS